MKRREFLKASTASAAIASMPWNPALGQARRDTLLAISENGPNNLDIHGVGTNRPGYEASWNVYDRLLTFGVKKDAQGQDHYDYTKLEPELAESWNLTPTSVTFKLRRDAKFHDGTPVTAKDVKWSFDRAVTVGGFPTFQMRAGSLEKPEQFVVVDDNTLRIDFLRSDKLTMPDLAVPVPVVINSGLAQKNATAADPWAMEWLKGNTAGSGAYMVERWVPGTELVFRRNDDWKGGPRPALQRVIWRTIPQAGNRRALLERGDADISFDLPNKDFNELQGNQRLSIIGTPVENALQYIGMNCAQPPFNNVKLRQAVAYAIPYQAIMDAVVFGRAKPMFGGRPQAIDASWPQPHPYTTDLDRARALMAEAGFPNGLETTLSFDLGLAGLNEPICVLVQESLARIGIRTTINKIPGANWRNELLKKSMPLITNTFGGWLNYPDYFFFWAYHGQDAVFNTMSYKNLQMDKLIDASRFSNNQAEYEGLVKDFVRLAFDEVPRIPLFQPFLNVAMQRSITGYRYWFHRQLDYRQLVKA
ncbi:MAG: ABC transporter substrate-binding protein [Alphaproteobacteria bacterium]|nr:ABC transporter substrate-binding protein [Alphaproteobacteria bacterium]